MNSVFLEVNMADDGANNLLFDVIDAGASDSKIACASRRERHFELVMSIWGTSKI